MKNFKIILFILLLHSAIKSEGQIINDVFDESPGQNFYQNGFGPFNWVDATAFSLTNHAGSEAFLSANGSGSPFNDLGLTKELGGVIQDTVYTVSFYIAKYTSTSIAYSDFSQLRIGGSAGTYQWIQTPNPIQGVWQQWTAMYTPDTADVGDPFDFVAVFTLPGNNNSIAIDGPVTVTAENITSVNKLQDEPLKLYPNPATTSFTIYPEYSGRFTISEIEIYNILGEKVYSQPQTSNLKLQTIDIRQLLPGVYYVTVTNDKGNKITSKFIKW